MSSSLNSRWSLAGNPAPAAISLTTSCIHNLEAEYKFGFSKGICKLHSDMTQKGNASCVVSENPETETKTDSGNANSPDFALSMTPLEPKE